MNPFAWLRRRALANQISAVIAGYGAAPIRLKLEFGAVLIFAAVLAAALVLAAWRRWAEIEAGLSAICVVVLVFAAPIIALRSCDILQSDRQAAATGWLSAAPASEARKRAWRRMSAARAGLVQAAPIGLVLCGAQLAMGRPDWAAGTAGILAGAVIAGVVLGEATGRSAGRMSTARRQAWRQALPAFASGSAVSVSSLTWTAPRTRLTVVFLLAVVVLVSAALIASAGARPDGLGPPVSLIISHVVFIGLFRTPDLLFSPLLQLSGARFAPLVGALARRPAIASAISFAVVGAIAFMQGEQALLIWAAAVVGLVVLNGSWVVVAVAFPERAAVRQMVYLVLWGLLAGPLAVSLPLGALIGAFVFAGLWRRARAKFRGRRL